MTAMATTDLPAAAPPRKSAAALVAPAVAGGAVALALGVYGRVHDATGDSVVDFGFPTIIAMKAWLASGAALLAVWQLISALWMWNRLPFVRSTPRFVPFVHRWSGTAAFLLSLPVAYHCLWSLGFHSDRGARVLVHGLLGCTFYGAFATKLL